MNKFIEAPIQQIEFRDFIEVGNENIPELFGRSYVLGELFYNLAPLRTVNVSDTEPEPVDLPQQPMTRIEIMLQHILNGTEGEIDKDVLKLLCYDSVNYTHNQKIYFVPLLLLILDTVLMSRSNGFRGL